MQGAHQPLHPHQSQSVSHCCSDASTRPGGLRACTSQSQSSSASWAPLIHHGHHHSNLCSQLIIIIAIIIIITTQFSKASPSSSSSSSSPHSSQSCNILCMKTLLRLLHHHPTYKDVFRDVGLLEVVVVCLQRFSALLTPDDPGHLQETLVDLNSCNTQGE